MLTVDSIPLISNRGNPETISPPAQSPQSLGPPVGPPGKLPTVDPPKFDPDPSDFDFPHRKYKKQRFFRWRIQKQIQDFDLGIGEMLCARSLAKSVYRIFSIHPFHATCILCFKCSRLNKL